MEKVEKHGNFFLGHPVVSFVIFEILVEIGSVNPLKPDVWERSVGPRGGPQGPPYKINEGVV